MACEGRQPRREQDSPHPKLLSIGEGIGHPLKERIRVKIRGTRGAVCCETGALFAVQDNRKVGGDDGMTKAMEREPRPEKVREVENLRELITSSSTAILTDYRGLNVKSMADLRRRLREANTVFRVVKNTLFKRAAAGTAMEKLVEGLEGPTAVASTSEDPVAAAKSLLAYIREARSPMTIKGALVDGHILDAKAVQELSTFPSKPELIAMVVGGLQSPITGLVGTLNTLIAEAVMTLKAVAEKKAA